VWPLASAFIDIAIHRRGPDCLPASRFLVALLLAVYFPIGLLVLYLRGAYSGFQLAFFIGDTALYIGFIFAILRFFKLDSRFPQTISALLGTDIFINCLSLPVAILGGDGGDGTGTVFLWVYLALFLWWIDVSGYILSKATRQPYIVGLMFVILYVMTSLSIHSAMTETAA
jgi:hypothetical protein